MAQRLRQLRAQARVLARAQLLQLRVVRLDRHAPRAADDDDLPHLCGRDLARELDDGVEGLVRGLLEEADAREGGGELRYAVRRELCPEDAVGGVGREARLSGLCPIDGIRERSLQVYNRLISTISGRSYG